MSDITNLKIEMDHDLRQEAEELFSALGMSLSTAINIFVRQAVQEKAVPFPIRLDEKRQFNMLIDDMRATAASHGFMTDEEIEAEIKAARASS